MRDQQQILTIGLRLMLMVVSHITLARKKKIKGEKTLGINQFAYMKLIEKKKFSNGNQF